MLRPSSIAGLLGIAACLLSSVTWAADMIQPDPERFEYEGERLAEPAYQTFYGTAASVQTGAAAEIARHFGRSGPTEFWSGLVTRHDGGAIYVAPAPEVGRAEDTADADVFDLRWGF